MITERNRKFNDLCNRLVAWLEKKTHQAHLYRLDIEMATARSVAKIKQHGENARRVMQVRAGLSEHELTYADLKVLENKNNEALQALSRISEEMYKQEAVRTTILREVAERQGLQQELEKLKVSVYRWYNDNSKHSGLLNTFPFNQL